ncbi:MAG: acyl--CoA ligase [Candidatus Nomurabacteria bacterium]|jgi:acyl-CoA synthetase (AMP-forming)/AMP-acid ligase II|nr:acyl--CoA ligase [Candidatus Nomurabacteria bacterium]
MSENKIKLKTGQSVYEHLRQAAQVRPRKVSQDYYGSQSTYAEDLRKIDNFARAINKLNQNPDGTLAFSTLIHPSNLIGYMAQNKQGRPASFINPTVIRDNPELALDKLDTETLFISEPFYHTAKEGIASSKVKNIIIVPLTEGATDEKDLITDVREHKGGVVKSLPTSLILKNLQKGYRAIKKADLIPGVNYYNYDEFIAAAAGDKTPVANRPRPNRPTLYLHTSGTTGAPKIVPKSDNSFTLSHNAYMSLDGLDVKPDDRSSSYYPLFPTTMMQWALTTWIEGIEQVENPLAGFNGLAARRIHDQRVTVATLNTQAYRSFLTTPLEAGSMPFFWFPAGGGEYLELRIAQELNRRFQELGMPNALVLSYGFSEGNPGTHMMIKPFTNYNPERANVVGRGVGRARARVVGPDGREVSRGKRGLVEVKPDSKPFPYLGREDEWHCKWTKDGYYKTEDVGVMDESGHLHVEGRHKHRFVGRDGEEHYLFDINRVVNGNPKTLRAIPVELAYKVKGKAGAVVAFVQLKPGQESHAEAVLHDLITRAKKDLKPGARPLAYRFVKTFPIDGSTKTDLKTLSQQRELFYTIEKGDIVAVSFAANGKIVKKPVRKIKITTKF